MSYQLPNLYRKQRRWRRFIRALWRDSSALWHEFRVPIIVFVIVTLGGGFLYGELYLLERGEFIPYIDRPYIILQLMILETPESAPGELSLIAFWYLLPVIFVFIIGRGVAEFVRLFFNRDARRDAWRTALASTYRNHIIVLGAGHVGMRVIYELHRLGNDLVVVDNSPDQGVEEKLSAWGIPLLVLDGRLPETFQQASLRHADSLVICTGNDHLNLEIIMRVRDMNPDIRIVARVWENQFARQIKDFFGVQSVLSSSDLAAPVFAGAALGIEITQTMQINSVEYSMLRLIVNEGSFMDGATIGELQDQNDMDVVLHGCDDSVDVQPDRDIIVQAGDTLVVFAQHERILRVVGRNREKKRR